MLSNQKVDTMGDNIGFASDSLVRNVYVYYYISTLNISYTCIANQDSKSGIDENKHLSGE